VDAAPSNVGKEDWVRLGFETQRRALTLLTNNHTILPLPASAKSASFYIEGINSTALTKRGLKVVNSTEQADYAFLRFTAPYEPRPGGFEKNYHSGSLEFNATEQARQAAIYTAVPTIVDIFLDRPPAVPEIAEKAAAFMVNFGASAEAFLDVVFGEDCAGPEGKLPFDLPRSMKAVEASREDVPFDTENPVFRYGWGLRYEN
jgi:hypothetical protein